MRESEGRIDAYLTAINISRSRSPPLDNFMIIVIASIVSIAVKWPIFVFLLTGELRLAQSNDLKES